MVVALAGFLVRGGIVLLALPAVMLPSTLGVAGIVGVSGFGIDGQPTPYLLRLFVAVAIVLAIWLFAAAIFGSLVDCWLVEAALDPGGTSSRTARPLPSFALLVDLAAIRAVCLLPIVASLVFAVNRVYAVVYQELTAPTDLSSPLVLRVILGAVDAILLMVVAWLASEAFAAIWVRRVLLSGQGLWGTLRGTLGQIARRPLSTVMTAILTSAGSAIAIGLALVATSLAFGLCLQAARLSSPVAVTLGIGPLSTTRDFRPIVFLGAAALLGATWLLALVLSGLTSAWRSATTTTETLDAMRSESAQWTAAESSDPAGGGSVGLSG